MQGINIWLCGLEGRENCASNKNWLNSWRTDPPDVATRQASICLAQNSALWRLSAEEPAMRARWPLFNLFLTTCLLSLFSLVFNNTMSFGFSVGDFVAVLQLANDVQKQFVDAPSQFRAISEEWAFCIITDAFAYLFSNRVKSLSIVLQDIDDILPTRDFTSHQKTELGNVVKNCRSILQELDNILIEFKELDPVAKCVDGKPRRVWKRFRWDQKDVNELRSRISSNILLLTTFLGQVNRYIKLGFFFKWTI